MNSWPRNALRLVGAIGTLIFSVAFAFTLVTPDAIEKYAANFIENEVSDGIDARIDSIQPPEGDGIVSKFAKGLYEKNLEEIEAAKENLRTGAHKAFARAISEARNLDCECRQKWENTIREGFEGKITLLQATNEKVVGFIQSTYLDVVAKLKTDLRIFTGVNACIFFILLLVSWLKPQAILHLFVPGILLAASTLICSYFYIFEQDWLYTIIYSDYIGFYYLGYLGAVFALLCDIVFNKARITTEIANMILNAIGSALSLVPC